MSVDAPRTPPCSGRVHVGGGYGPGRPDSPVGSRPVSRQAWGALPGALRGPVTAFLSAPVGSWSCQVPDPTGAHIVNLPRPLGKTPAGVGLLPRGLGSVARTWGRG